MGLCHITALFVLVLVSGSCVGAYRFPVEFPDLQDHVYNHEGIPTITTWNPPTVTVPQGKIQGIYSSLGARVFKSIPFAQPPLRWQDPQNITKFKEDPLMATKDPKMCPQSCKVLDLCEYKQNEDCLYLNVYAPPNAKPESLYPVMLFIYGGAFIVGYSAQTVYDGDYIASNTGTILVTFNYRLGALGFLTYEDKATGEIINGNFGFKDQQKAMEWVKKNIASFGGDPNKITLFGESAGASSVGIHMTNPDSAKLFNQAIIESDPFSIEYLKVPKARDLGQRFAKTLECDSIECLKNKTYKEIVDHQMNFISGLLFPIPNCAKPNLTEPFEVKFQLLMPWAPLVDGITLKDQPVKIFASNKLAANVSLIIGTNWNEGRILLLPTLDSILSKYHVPFVPWVYEYFVRNFFHKAYTRKVIEQYKPTWLSVKDNKNMIAKLFTDYMFVCPTRHAVENVNTGKGKWVYVFHQPYTHKEPIEEKYCEDYSCHGDELPYVFHTAKTVFNNTQSPPTVDEMLLEETMMTYWVNFAHNGDPNVAYDSEAHASTLTSYIKQMHENGSELANWPDYSKKEMRLFDTAQSGMNPLISQYPQKDKCDFFDGLIKDYNMCVHDDC